MRCGVGLYEGRKEKKRIKKGGIITKRRGGCECFMTRKGGETLNIDISSQVDESCERVNFQYIYNICQGG